MTKLEKQIWLWHVECYGPGVDIPATYRKLLEEVGELGEALMLGDAEDVVLEAGDCAVLLLTLLRGHGCKSLGTALGRVFDKLELRRLESAAKEKSNG